MRERGSKVESRRAKRVGLLTVLASACLAACAPAGSGTGEWNGGDGPEVGGPVVADAALDLGPDLAVDMRPPSAEPAAYGFEGTWLLGLQMQAEDFGRLHLRLDLVADSSTTPWAVSGQLQLLRVNCGAPCLHREVGAPVMAEGEVAIALSTAHEIAYDARFTLHFDRLDVPIEGSLTGGPPFYVDDLVMNFIATDNGAAPPPCGTASGTARAVDIHYFDFEPPEGQFSMIRVRGEDFRQSAPERPGYGCGRLAEFGFGAE